MVIPAPVPSISINDTRNYTAKDKGGAGIKNASPKAIPQIF